MSDVRDKSPWYGTAEDGLRWILRDETCKTEQIELVAEKALEKIEALLSLSADKDREIESLQRETDEWHDASKDDYKTIRRLEEELDLAKSAAITPEMRERMRKALQIIEEHNITTSIYAETDAGVIFRDLLGEQG